MDEQTYTVGQVAGLAGVTVRTLHHYDEIGLLPPSGRAANGYRTYTAADVARDQLRAAHLVVRQGGVAADPAGG